MYSAQKINYIELAKSGKVKKGKNSLSFEDLQMNKSLSIANETIYLLKDFLKVKN